MTQTTAARIFALIFESIGYTDGDDRTVAAIAAEIDRLTAERDGYEAGMRFQFDRAEDYKAQRDEARAEVARLTPAAEAWIAYDDYMMCPEEHEAEKFQVWVAAHNAAKSAQVARAAKEAKP